MESLRARGETTNDLLFNIFKAYKTVKDTEFQRYIMQKESNYEEGDINLTAERLMMLAENKYKTLVDKKQWRTPTADKEQIVALQSQLNSLKQKRPPKKQNFQGAPSSEKGHKTPSSQE